MSHPHPASTHAEHDLYLANGPSATAAPALAPAAAAASATLFFFLLFFFFFPLPVAIFLASFFGLWSSPSPQSLFANPPHILRIGHHPQPAPTHIGHVVYLANSLLMSPLAGGVARAGFFFPAPTRESGEWSFSPPEHCLFANPPHIRLIGHHPHPAPVHALHDLSFLNCDAMSLLRAGRGSGASERGMRSEGGREGGRSVARRTSGAER